MAEEQKPVIPKTILNQSLPEQFATSLQADWGVSPNLEPNRQLVRLVNKAEDYLAGIVTDGMDKDRARLEAGRMLTYLRSMAEDGGVVSGEQQTYLQQEINRLWNDEGGKEANDTWRELQNQAETAGQPEKLAVEQSPEDISPAEQLLNSLEYRVGGISKMFDSSVQSIDQAIDFILTNDAANSRVSGLELCKKILNRRINPQEEASQLAAAIAQVRESMKNGSLVQGGKEAENQALSSVRNRYGKIIKTFVEVTNSLESIAKNSDSGLTKTAIEAAHKDIEDLLRVVGGIDKVNAARGEKVDFETMEPVDVVESQDPNHSGGDIIAEVAESGYQFSGDLQLFGGIGTDVIHKPKVEVYKSNVK